MNSAGENELCVDFLYVVDGISYVITLRLSSVVAIARFVVIIYDCMNERMQLSN